MEPQIEIDARSLRLKRPTKQSSFMQSEFALRDLKSCKALLFDIVKKRSIRTSLSSDELEATYIPRALNSMLNSAG